LKFPPFLLFYSGKRISIEDEAIKPMAARLHPPFRSLDISSGRVLRLACRRDPEILACMRSRLNQSSRNPPKK